MLSISSKSGEKNKKVICRSASRLGCLADPGVSPPRQGGFVVVTASDWAGYQAPELRFLMVVNDNAITI